MTRVRTAAVRQARGYTLVEVLVAVGILSLVMGAAYGSLISQIRQHSGQVMAAQMMHAGRLAFTRMAAEIANAGFGVPVPTTPSVAPSLLVAESNRLRFWAAVATTHTFLTGAAAIGTRNVPLLSTKGVKVGTSLYVADNNRWHLGTVQSVSGNVVQLAAPLPYNFAAGALATPMEQVTYELVNGALVRNGRVFIPNVTGLRFAYDKTALDGIRLIDVEMTVEARAAAIPRTKRAAVTLGARIAPPNLAL